MKLFFIVLLTILIVALIAFAAWFIVLVKIGKCPLCAIKHLGGSKLTIDASQYDDYNNNVSPSPIMGWSSWNTLRNHISQEDIIEMAEAMKKLGLLDAGYKYLNLDDCWQSSMRDADGKLQGDLETFPDGIEALCKKVNAMGYKLGIYSSNGSLTCEDLPASLGNELLDAKTFASWGIEYLKYDFCHHQYISGSTPVIGFVELSRLGSHASIKLVPEDAALTGKAKLLKQSKLPTGKGIAFLNHNAGTASFDFNADGGDYVATIHYKKNILNPKRYMQLDVNGKIYEVFFPSGRSFTPDAKVQINIKLQSGTNTIKLFNPVVTNADSSYIQYRRMSNALTDASKAWAAYNGSEIKPITFSICEWGFAKPWNWGAKAGNMWRTTLDIAPVWESITHIYSRNVKLYKFAKPSHVNDPDMLEVGNGKLTEDENKSHFTLWCMMAAPLVLGNDIRKLLDGSEKSQMITDILTNKSLILVDQDPLVKQAKRIKKGKIDILARPMNNGDIVVCFFNKTKKKMPVSLQISDLHNEPYLDFNPITNDYKIHDLWTDERVTDTSISSSVNPHGVKAYRISQ